MNMIMHLTHSVSLLSGDTVLAFRPGNFSMNRLLLSSSPVTLSICLAHILLLFLQQSHGSVSSVAQGSLARDGPLSDLESHGSVSSAVQRSFAGDGPLSDPESHLLCEAHLLETGLSLIRSLMIPLY